MADRVELSQSGRTIRVTSESADYWRGLGFEDVKKSAAKSEPKAPARTTRKKSD